MPAIPMTVPVSVDGHTYQVSYVDWPRVFHPAYLAHDGRMTVVGTWGSPLVLAVARQWGVVYERADLPCPYCQGPLYRLVSVPNPAMVVARCMQERTLPDGRLAPVLEQMPPTHDQLACEPCAQFFSVPKAR